MRSRAIIAILLATLLVAPLFADRRHAVSLPENADILGMGSINGAAVAGTVASVDGNIVTLNSGTAAPIRIDASAAKIVGEGKRDAGTVADITRGSRITAFIAPGAATSGAPLVARLITIESRPDLFVSGTIESIDVAGSKMTVLGLTINVDASTSFASAMPTFAPIRGLADLAVGQLVAVDAKFAASGILATRVVVSMPMDSTTVLHGVVKSISATSWVLTTREGKEISVTVNEQTKIVGNPKVGDQVEILARLDSSSAYIALVIGAMIPPPPPQEGELRGIVKAIGPDQWTIGGPPGSMRPDVLVKVTATTRIYANPKVGDAVVVKGNRDSSGLLVATSIVRDAEQTTNEFRGTIATINGDTWTLNTMSMQPMPMEVRLTKETVVYANPKVGDNVVVAGVRDERGVIIAKKIAKVE